MSKSEQAQYLVGIDLGTTHTVVCYADLSNGAQNAQPQLFEIEQLIAPGEVAKRPLLPSFRYHPAEGELAKEQRVLPWAEQKLPGDSTPYVVGELARNLGSKVEGRLIASAKSWLSHDKVDRSAEILPWAGADDVAKVSPVIASASYLLHVRSAWNHQYPDAPLERQELVLTVPASFDEAARALTLQAAELAGLENLTLLEEPQAVCYHWFFSHRNSTEALKDTKLLFVVDVGGGTTDLSLIEVASHASGIKLNRIAVGDHLMLGGDNVDLALAHSAEQRITQGAKKLSAASLSQLIQQARAAKELLLGEQAPQSAKVTLMGGGSRLIGGAKSAELSRDEVHALALEGFFPLSEFTDMPSKRASAMVEFGLPYAPDPAVSKYLAQFLTQHQNSCRKALGMDDSGGESTPAIPDSVLFNGGVFNSPTLAERALALLSQWRGQPVQRLLNENPDTAVAFGAVAFGLSRHNQQMRIGGGAARSYFLKLNAEGDQSQGICLLPKGSEEGQAITLQDQRFLLQVNKPVQFMLAAYAGDEAFAPGQIVDLHSDAERFVLLPPLLAALENNEAMEQVEVQLITRLTEVGTLDIQCQALNSDQRWKVEFELRKQLQQQHTHTTQALPKHFEQAIQALEDVYGSSDKKADPKAVKQLRQTLEKLLGPRDQWDTPLARALFDALWERRKRRRRSQAHERVWFNLAGYCLRPGFGFPADDWRVENAWSLYPQGLQFDKENQLWAEWWTFWRRAAGGLNETAQKKIYKDIAKFINPAALRNLKLKTEVKNKSYEDMVRLAGSLESLPKATKIELGGWLCKRLEKSSETQTSWWALGRVGGRELFHGGAQNVLDAADVQPWIKVIAKQDWKKNPNAAFAAVMIGRVTNDRSRDLTETDRSAICDQLTQSKSPELWKKLVMEYIELDDKESKRVFGEALPAGLTLLEK